MYRTVLSFVLMLFSLNLLCYAVELPVDSLVHGVNQARLTIQSGEIHTKTTTEYTSQKTEEEIAAWIKTEKEKELKDFKLGIDVKQYERDYLIPRLNSDAKSFRQHTKHEQATVVFDVLELDNATRPRLYQYKLTMVESPGYPLDNMSNRFRASDVLHLLAYDMQTQVKENIGNIIHAFHHASFFASDEHYGYFQFSLFGKSPFHVPSDAKHIGKEAIDNVECYVLEFIAPDKTGRKVHLWVDPTRDFCVRQVDYSINQKAKTPYARITYKNFKKFKDVWFPQVAVDTYYRVDSTVRSQSMTVVIDAELNVDFPKNFFKINKNYYSPPGMGHLQDSGTSPTKTDPGILLCGPESLYRICELLEVSTNLAELKKLSGFVPERGTTMLGLKTAAVYKGLAPAGVRASVELLKRKKVPLPAIAYVNADHFLVFESANKDGVKITDSAEKYPPHLTWDELSDIWYGDLLIFDKKKAHRAKQKQTPLAFTETPEYDFGKALGGSEIKHTFAIKNIGQKPLEIISVTETCACTASILSQDKIPPGKTGSISAVLTVPPGNEQIQESLLVLTNDPTQSMLRLTLKAESFTPLKTFPELITVGNQPPLQNPLTKQVSLHIQEGTQIQSVRTNSDHLKATLEMTANIPHVNVQFLPTLPVGKFSHNILVDYIYKGEPATHSFIAFGEVIGELQVVPNRLFFGLIKDPASFSKTLTISANNAQPFQITAVESKTKAVTFIVEGNEKKTHYKLTASISQKAQRAELSGEVIIHTSSPVQPTVRVPFFGIITDAN